MYSQHDEPCLRRKFLSLSLCVLTGVFLFLNIFNEYNYAYFSKELRPIAKNAIPVSCIPLEENNGKLIHINCPLQDLETFYAPPEFSSNLYSFQGVFFETKMEMFQWTRDRGSLGLLVRPRFADHVIPTPYNFLISYRSRKNPSYFPHISTVGRRYATYVKVGNYRLPKESLVSFQRKKKLELTDDGWFTESQVKPPFVINHLNTNVFDNYLYTGDPKKPQIGDLRISFYGSAATHATVVGIQKSRLLGTIFEIEGIPMQNRRNIILLSEDNRSILDQMNDFIFKNYASIYALWFLRVLTFICVTFQAFQFLQSDPRGLYWKFSVSILASTIILLVVPCLIWFFCDISVFLFLLIFLFLLFIALLFLYNSDSDSEYMEMKNYKRKSLPDSRNFTFSNLNDKFVDVPDVNTVFGSESDLSFSPSNNQRDPTGSAPVYIYQ